MIAIARAAGSEARALIVEYAQSLGVDLSFQHFDDEITNLDDMYESIFVARDGDVLAGCVALRRIDDETCEMKRLYVRPQFRGLDLGRRLAEHAIAAARSSGYLRIRLDTLPSMHAAIAVYRSLGFVEIAPYRFNPVEGTRFLELSLRKT